MSRKPASPNNTLSEDQTWMLRAVDLALKGRFSVSPNPMVGACFVKNGKLISEGCHRVYGGDHAEIEALKKAGKKAAGATLYVTLEPCASWGKTPPCADAVIRSGVRRVVIGALDPNAVNRAKGVKRLRDAGLKITTGIFADVIARQNESFFKYMKSKTPFVTLKMAQSLDGKIATRTGHTRWISSKPSREFVHRLRSEQDAVLVGTGTLRKDNPFLSPRIKALPGRESKPWRIVLDPRFEVSPRARVFDGKQMTVVVISKKMVGTKAFDKKKIPSAVLLPVSERNARLDLSELLKKLGALGVSKLLVEGGGELAWSFVREKLVDKILWVIAPKFIGGKNAKTSLEGEGVALASDALPVEIISQSFLGEDLLIEGKLK